MSISTEWLSQYPALTASTYGQVLRDFAARTGVEAEKGTPAHFAQYRKDIADQAANTVHKKIACLSSFHKYLNLRGVRTDNPLRAIRKPKVDSLRSVKYLTMDQVQDMMLSFGDSKKDIRDRAIISVFMHGLRLAELVGLDVEDFREGNLRVLGKGNKTRIVPLSPVGQDYLGAYIRNRKSGPMFLSMFRAGNRVERRMVQKIVYTVTERIGARSSAHSLRHSAATIMYRATKDLAAVQELLGHASPETTKIYAHLDVSDLRAAVEKSALLGDMPQLRLLENIA